MKIKEIENNILKYGISWGLDRFEFNERFIEGFRQWCSKQESNKSPLDSILYDKNPFYKLIKKDTP